MLGIFPECSRGWSSLLGGNGSDSSVASDLQPERSAREVGGRALQKPEDAAADRAVLDPTAIQAGRRYRGPGGRLCDAGLSGWRPQADDDRSRSARRDPNDRSSSWNGEDRPVLPMTSVHNQRAANWFSRVQSIGD